MPVKRGLPSKEGKKVQSAKLKVKNEKGGKVAVKVTKAQVVSVPVYSLAGRASGTLALPKEIFGQQVNEKLLAQALRVYSNQREFSGSTKTRGEVQGSTAKIFKQKGTGRARHGQIRAPIFVGGGIVFGPKSRKVVLDLPKKMKKKALIYALSAKAKDKEIIGLSGVDKATGKTKEIAKLINSLWSMVYGKEEKQNTRSALIVTAEKVGNLVRGARNIPGIAVLAASQLNVYEVLKSHSLLITKEAIEKLATGIKK